MKPDFTALATDIFDAIKTDPNSIPRDLEPLLEHIYYTGLHDGKHQERKHVLFTE